MNKPHRWIPVEEARWLWTVVVVESGFFYFYVLARAKRVPSCGKNGFSDAPCALDPGSLRDLAHLPYCRNFYRAKGPRWLPCGRLDTRIV